MSNPKGRVVENPVNGEKVTFIKTGEETNGEYLLTELELREHGKIPLHYHLIFTERFKVLEGELSLRVGKDTKILRPGDEVVVHPKVLHRFWNDSGKIVRFQNELRPAGDFEKAIRAGDGLASDGKAGKNGLPRNPLHLALIFGWVASYFPVVPVFIQKGLFGGLAGIAKLFRMDKDLEKYL